SNFYSMTTEEKQSNTAPTGDQKDTKTADVQGRTRDPQGRPERRPRRGGPRREARVRPEFDHKTVSIRRVTRVTSGGRRFSFSVTLVAGNRKGMVGVGQGKAGDTPLAIDKALRNAKKHMITVHTTKD